MHIDDWQQRASDAGRAADVGDVVAAMVRCSTDAIGEEPADSDCYDGACDFVNHTLHSH